VGIGVDFALIHQAFLMIVEKFDRVFDRNHVLFAFAVDLVQHRGQRGRFSGACRTGHQNQPARLVAQRLHDRRKAQRIKPLDFPRNRTEDGADGAALIEYVAAETG
jgi:hypothetical protein